MGSPIDIVTWGLGMVWHEAARHCAPPGYGRFLFGSVLRSLASAAI